MKNHSTVAIIAEYNPFHNGHAYQISEAKRLSNADFAVVIMSGDFVQRGEPAVMDKYLRTSCALYGGADIVFELPSHFATASSEYFATGAVKLLDRLGFIDSLCFGSECNDIGALRRLASFLLNEPAEYSSIFKKNIKPGLSYPVARVQSLKEYSLIKPQELSESDIDLLNMPNNILGIEYIKALMRLKSDITPFTIERLGSGYHSQELSTYPSASAMRSSVNASGIESIRPYMPESSYNCISGEYNVKWPIVADDLTPLLLYKLMKEDAESLTEYRDIDYDLACRISNIPYQLSAYTEFAELLKTKKYTAVRISRALLHMLLDDKESDTAEYHSLSYAPYIRLLGIKSHATHLLRELNDRLPGFVITKFADAKKQLDNDAYRMFSYDINANKLYNQLIFNKYGTVPTPEPSIPHPIIL